MRALRGTVIALAVVALLLGGLFYADRTFHSRVEREVATSLTTQLGTPQPPTVDIEGWPFLTQIVTGSIGTVRVGADDIGTTNEAALAIARTDLVLTDVTSTDRFATMNVAQAEGSARIDYAALQGLAGVPLTFVGDGRLQVVVTGELFSQQIGAKITGKPALDVGGQTVNLTDPKITVAGVDLPDFTSRALIRALLKPIQITGVPFGLRITSIDCGDDGVHAAVAGENIPLTR